MIKTIRKTMSKFVPSTIVSGDVETFAGAQNFVFIAFSAIVIHLIFAVIAYGQGMTLIAATDTVAAALILCDYFAFLWLKKVNLAIHGLVFITLSGMLMTNLSSGGIDAPGIVWYASVPVLVYYLLDTWSAIFWGAVVLSISGLMAVHVFPVQHLIPPESLSFLKFMNLSICTGFLFLATRKNKDDLDDDLKLIRDRKEEVMQALINLKNREEKLAKQLGDHSTLVRTVGHDLMTPIHLISVALKELQPFDEGQKAALKRAEKAINALSEIVGNVKDYQAIATGKRELRLGPVNIDEVVLRAQEFFQYDLEKKHLKINLIKDAPNLQYVVLADSVSFTNAVFNNIFSNAIKFSNPNSTIDIKLSLKGTQICLEVIDYGIGIPEDLLPHLFSPNRVTSRNGTAGEKGTGFGLPLAKAYMEKFGGDISVNDHPVERGTNFSLTLPRYDHSSSYVA